MPHIWSGGCLVFPSRQSCHSHHLLCSYRGLPGLLTAVPRGTPWHHLPVESQPTHCQQWSQKSHPTSFPFLEHMFKQSFSSSVLANMAPVSLVKQFHFLTLCPRGMPNCSFAQPEADAHIGRKVTHFHFQSTWILTRELCVKPVFKNNNNISFKGVICDTGFGPAHCSWFPKQRAHRQQGCLFHHQPTLQEQRPTTLF